MKIRFNKNVSIEVVTNYNEETDEVETEDVNFMEGDEEDVDILNSDEDANPLKLSDISTLSPLNVQFGNGDCCYGLCKDCFDVV